LTLVCGWSQFIEYVYKKSGFNDKWLGSKHQDEINFMGRVRANYSSIAAERLDPLPNEELDVESIALFTA
jgi:hypothetical protein